jgi:proteasome assembly chaperone (PAC2) family protein
MKTWIDWKKRPKVDSPTVILGSQGLRSVGSTAIEYLIDEWDAEHFASLYSTAFPVVYQGLPYAGVPGLPGAIVKDDGQVTFAGADFYHHENHIIVKGYNPDNLGQYPVATRTVEFLAELGISRIITLGGFVYKDLSFEEERRVSFCATDGRMAKSMKEKGLRVFYVGPFLGFSALVLGLGREMGIPGVGLFGQTVPLEESPMLPDPPAVKAILDALGDILEKEIDTGEIPPHQEVLFQESGGDPR